MSRSNPGRSWRSTAISLRSRIFDLIEELSSEIVDYARSILGDKAELVDHIRAAQVLDPDPRGGRRMLLTADITKLIPAEALTDEVKAEVEKPLRVTLDPSEAMTIRVGVEFAFVLEPPPPRVVETANALNRSMSQQIVDTGLSQKPGSKDPIEFEFETGPQLLLAGTALTVLAQYGDPVAHGVATKFRQAIKEQKPHIYALYEEHVKPVQDEREKQARQRMASRTVGRYL